MDHNQYLLNSAAWEYKGKLALTGFCTDQVYCNNFDYSPCVSLERRLKFFEITPLKLLCFMTYSTAFEPKLIANRQA